MTLEEAAGLMGTHEVGALLVLPVLDSFRGTVSHGCLPSPIPAETVMVTLVPVVPMFVNSQRSWWSST